jgi:hypothetical protein
MKRIIRLTESDLTRIVRRTINEMEDEEDYGTMRGRFFDDEDEGDEEWGETDMGEEELQDLIEEARDFLENECGYDLHDINLMGEEDIVDALYDEGNDNLANNIESLMEKEGFYNADEDEPYDSIGGHSVNDLKKAFAKTKSKDEELGEGWDDFTQKKRYPEDYKPEKYERIPRDYFKSPRRLDPEGTIGMPRKEKPFDDYEDFDDEEFV